MATSSLAISPRKLRSDLYSYSYQNDSNTPLVISVLASLIERTMARNERIVKNCRWALSKDIRTRGPSVYVVAYVYIDRFCQANPGFRISSRNVHRLLITTIMVASKYVEDMNYRNSYFARVGGLTTKELNKLELEFVFLMGFKLHVNVSVFSRVIAVTWKEKLGIGGGYHIEKTLRCAEEIKSGQQEEKRYNQIARIML
ncbi:hypothetical protein OIU85_020781 [Salix viminalis]|uniref:Cyclin n=1 Tax=Salix viminalis TaxID=40686 RepID=A0A9Q0UH96_SALVM|nr:hypothetical protein OIU85_020781 [Salix viminalis]